MLTARVGVYVRSFESNNIILFVIVSRPIDRIRVVIWQQCTYNAMHVLHTYNLICSYFMVTCIWCRKIENRYTNTINVTLLQQPRLIFHDGFPSGVVCPAVAVFFSYPLISRCYRGSNTTTSTLS